MSGPESHEASLRRAFEDWKTCTCGSREFHIEYLAGGEGLKILCARCPEVSYYTADDF